MREVVHGTRFVSPNGFAGLVLSASAPAAAGPAAGRAPSIKQQKRRRTPRRMDQFLYRYPRPGAGRKAVSVVVALIARGSPLDTISRPVSRVVTVDQRRCPVAARRHWPSPRT